MALPRDKVYECAAVDTRRSAAAGVAARRIKQRIAELQEEIRELEAKAREVPESEL